MLFLADRAYSRTSATFNAERLLYLRIAKAFRILRKGDAVLGADIRAGGAAGAKYFIFYPNVIQL